MSTASVESDTTEDSDEVCDHKIKCCVCFAPGLKRCVRWRAAYYCGSSCQKEDWKNHKAKCGETLKSHRRLTILADDGEYDEEWNSMLFDAYEDIRYEQGDLIVKVFLNTDGVMCAQSQDGAFDCCLEFDSPHARDVARMILEKGHNNCHGFFSAFMSENKQLVLITNTFFPNLGW